MGPDTWVNLVPRPHCPAKPAKPSATQAQSPREERSTPDRAKNPRTGFRWLWVTKQSMRSSDASSMSIASSSAHNTARTTTPTPQETEPVLSRASSSDSWLEVVRDGASSDDLTDLEDTNTVSLAPRREPRVRSIRLSSTSRSDAPAFLDESVDKEKAPESPLMHRCPEPGQEGPSLRLRSAGGCEGTPTNSKHNLHNHVSSESHLNTSCSGRNSQEGSLTVSRVAAACGVTPDSDLVWTFLAGMMLYFVSV